MTDQINVLMFAPAFAPNFFSEALVNSKLALAMLDAGWNVSVISASASADFVYSGNFGAPWELLRGIVHEVPPEAGSAGRFARINKAARVLAAGRHPVHGAKWAANAADAAFKLHQQRPFDLMITRSTSCIAHLPGLLFKNLVDVPWVANWNDPPPHLFPAPYSYPTSPVQRFFTDRYLRAAARRADVNTFPSERLMAYLSGPLELVDPRRMAVVPHIGFGRYGRPPRAEKDIFRISHAGNLSLERDPRYFLRALAKTIMRHPSIKFEFSIIGKMPDRALAEVEKLGLSGVVTYTPDIPFLACLEQLESADALLLIEARVANGIFFPSKIVDYCEVGRPVLAISPNEGVMRDLNDRYHFAYFADVGDPDAVVSALERLVSDWIDDKISLSGVQELRRQASPVAIVQQIARLVCPNV